MVMHPRDGGSHQWQVSRWWPRCPAQGRDPSPGSAHSPPASRGRCETPRCCLVKFKRFKVPSPRSSSSTAVLTSDFTGKFSPSLPLIGCWPGMGQRMDLMKCEPAYSEIPREGSLSVVGGRYSEHNNEIIIMIFYSQFVFSHGPRGRISIYKPNGRKEKKDSV